MRVLKMFFLTTMLLTSVSPMAFAAPTSKVPRFFDAQRGGSINVGRLERLMSNYYGNATVVVTDIRYLVELTFKDHQYRYREDGSPVWIYGLEATVGKHRGIRFYLYVAEGPERVKLSLAKNPESNSQELFIVDYEDLGLSSKPPYITR